MEHIKFVFDEHNYWRNTPIRIEVDYKAKMEVRFNSGYYLWTQFTVNDKQSGMMKGSGKIDTYLELMNALLEGSDICFKSDYEGMNVELNNGKPIGVKFRFGLYDVWTTIEINGHEMRWIHYPAYIKPVFDAINADNMKKLAIMEKVAAAGLNPLKHLEFDEKKLDRAKKASERMKGNEHSSGVWEIIEGYENAYNDFHNEGERIWKIEGITFFTEKYPYSGNSWNDSINFEACDENKNCYYSSVRKSAVGKMLVQQKITPTMRRKLHEGLRSDHEVFINRIEHYVNGANADKIPDWLTTELVERKLPMM